MYREIDKDTDEEEKMLLAWFIREAEKADIIEGWFSEGFDLVAIARRCELHGIRTDIKVTEETSEDLGGLHSVRKLGKYKVRMNSINHIDLMQKMKEMHYRDTELIKQVRSFSLSSVAKVFLNDDKVGLDGHSIYWLWENDRAKLREYNLHDSRLLKQLDDKIKITTQKLVEHQILNARVNDFTSTKKIDAYALREARRMGKRLFSTNKTKFTPRDLKSIVRARDDAKLDGAHRGSRKKDDANYQGGYVFDPKTGLYDDVTVYDFQSLYPSIIKTFNISPDSLAPADAPEDQTITLPTTGTKFWREKGVIPRIIQSVLDERNRIRFEEMPKYKKGSFEYENLHYRQYSLKVIANSMYGVMGATFSRYYKRECAEGITLTGQYLLKLMHKWMDDQGYRPIYGDTDSLFVLLPKGSDGKAIGDQVDEFLGKHLLEDFGINENHMHFDYESTYDRFLMQGKKKYAGSKDGKIAKLMGMETKKRDTLPLTDVSQRELIHRLLTEYKDEKYWQDWIMALMTTTFNGHLKPENLIMQKRLTKKLEDYANQNLIQVRIAKELREKHTSDGKITLWSQGAYIPYIVTDGSKKGGLQGVYAPEYVRGYDPTYYWNNTIFPALQRTLTAAFPNIEWEQYIVMKRKKYDIQLPGPYHVPQVDEGRNEKRKRRGRVSRNTTALDRALEDESSDSLYLDSLGRQVEDASKVRDKGKAVERDKS